MRGLTLSFEEVGWLVLCLGKGGGFLKAVGATSVLLHPCTGMAGTWFGLLWFRRGEGRFLKARLLHPCTGMAEGGGRAWLPTCSRVTD